MMSDDNQQQITTAPAEICCELCGEQVSAANISELAEPIICPSCIHFMDLNCSNSSANIGTWWW